jgi:hypothetical protein
MVPFFNRKDRLDTVNQWVSDITIKIPTSPSVNRSSDVSQLPDALADAEILLRNIDMIRIAISKLGSA